MKFRKKKTNDSLIISEFAEKCKISPLLANLLLTRGIKTVNEANQFLYGTAKNLNSPYLFPDMSVVVSRIELAISRNEKIIVYGDYDCDGVGATAIFILSFKDRGLNINHYIPVRAKEGYGLNKNGIKYIYDTYKPDLLISVDCGINSVEEVEYAKNLGIDVIITDHHQPGQILPDCPILNPFLSKNISPLCGAGVVFMLISALFGLEQALKYIDICAVSTIADIVPLIGDNRLIVKYGMAAIKKGHCRPGIKELFYSAKIDYKSVTTSDIGYKIAPRINAAGRLNTAEISLRLLTEDDTTLLHITADHLSLLNCERQEMNSQILDESLKMLKKYDFSKYKIIMLKGNWIEGVVGIVCAKIAELFNLPVILVCYQENSKILKGSARSINGINLFELFDKNNEKLLTYGGHEMAAGISFFEKDFDSILNQFNNYIFKSYESDIFERKTFYDYELNINDITDKTIKEITLLEPFGHENPAPVFLDKFSYPKFIQIGKSVHIKSRYKSGELIAFNRLNYIDLLKNNKFSFIYSIEKNYFNGRITTQFLLKEFKLDTNNFRKVDLIENFCKTFMVHNDSFLQTTRKENPFPILYVTYTEEGIQNLLNSYPNANLIAYENQKLELNNTIVISPSDDFPFEFFSRIVFHENIGNNFKNFLEKKNIKCEYINNEISINKISVDKLRNFYVKLKNNFTPFVKFVSAKALYVDIFTNNVYNENDHLDFIVAFYIFRELNLINITDDDIIKFNEKKVELTQSTLYNYINR